MPTARSFLLPLAAVSAICLSNIANAQEREVWACQQTGGSLLKWESGKWDVRVLESITVLLTIDAEGSSWKKGTGGQENVTCSEYFGLVSCRDNFAGTGLIALDRVSGRAGYSEIYGAIQSPSDATRDTPFVVALNCTKF